MNLDWTTFLLEGLNFLILVWILKRLLYRPVLEIIARRQQHIENSLAVAASRQSEAEALRLQYENRLQDWEAERNDARLKLREEMNAERDRQLKTLEVNLQAEREKQQAQTERLREDCVREAETQALAAAGRFTANLLERLASESLDERLIAVMLEDLRAMERATLSQLRTALLEHENTVHVELARPLDMNLQNHLQQSLAYLFEQEHLNLSMEVKPELIAGLRLSIGPWVLKANLGDELGFFHTGAQRVG